MGVMCANSLFLKKSDKKSFIYLDMRDFCIKTHTVNSITNYNKRNSQRLFLAKCRLRFYISADGHGQLLLKNIPAAYILNSTPKVKQKTFGVFYV